MMAAIPRDNYVGGRWHGSATREPNVNPSDLGDVVVEQAAASRAQAEEAVAAAAEAFPRWANAPIAERADLLDRVGQELARREAELGDLLAREEGKTLAEAKGEVARAALVFRFFAQEALRVSGELIESIRPGIEVEVRRVPIGPVALITPWNFPILIPAWKVAPALAFGNTVVLKPAGLVPSSAVALAAAFDAAGAPPGVFNLVCGPGREIGAALAESAAIRGVSFTGSVETGRGIAVACAKRGARVQLEMGGKNPLLVLDDADLDRALDCALQGAFGSTGQRCTASSRIIVTDAIHDRFVERLMREMRNLRVGDARDPRTAVGPVVDRRQLDQDLEYLRIARDEGAEVVGGERVERETEGFFLEPALLLGATNDMRTSREEIFGPIASVIRVDGYEEGLAVANDTDFGLTAGIVTRSLRHATHFRRHAEAGMVMVNVPTAGVDYHVPFGGTKASSYGPREQGRHAVDFYTAVKTGYVAA